MDAVRVVLIGDSIRMGYESAVRERLRAPIEVITTPENGRTSAHVLANLREWAIDHRPQLIHLNCGLHDLRREFGASENAVPLEDYAKNLEAIFTALQTETEAHLVWAQTTPVNQEWHHRTKDFDRLEAEVAAYNRRAVEIAGQKDIQVNDLHSLVEKAGRDPLLRDDGVHFTPSGSRLLGHAVADCVRKVLDGARFRGA